MDSAMQAIHNGADAIYIGGKNFGARAFAGNFSYDELKTVIDYAHLYGVKVYLTVNTLIYQHEINQFLEHVKIIYELGADALIMQDIGMIAQVGSRFPDVEIHASTQMHNHSDASLCFLKSLGIKRAVLAREMSLEQIKSLACDIQKEVFVHGALCISYSGQCLFSALTQNRSGNRGKCAQTCRMRYTLEDENGNSINTDGEYLLSPKDLALLEDVGELLEAGVHSFKIEGRMKSSEYVGHVTKIYSGLLNNYKNSKQMKVDGTDLNNLKKLFNRGLTKGHLLGAEGDELMGTLRPNHRGVPLGYVKSLSRDKIEVELSDTLNQGDGIKFEKSDTGFICNKIYLNGKLVSGAKRGDVIELDGKVSVSEGEPVVKTGSVNLEKSLKNYTGKKIPVSEHLIAKKSQELVLNISDNCGNSVTVFGDIVQPSKTSPTTESELAISISKLGDTPFFADKITYECDQDIFVAKSRANALRRSAIEKLIQLRTDIPNRRVLEYKCEPIRFTKKDDSPKLHVLVRNLEQFEAVKELDVEDIYTNDVDIYFGKKGEYKNLRLKTDKLSEKAPDYTGERLLVTDNGGIYKYKSDNDIVLEYSLNALNAETLSVLMGMSANRIALSPELDILQVGEMIKAFEQRNGQKPPLEALIYARYELMAMKHCVIANAVGQKKHCDICKKKQYFLADISGNQYPIFTDSNCNNYILSTRHETADVPALKRLGVSHFRVEFFDESADECSEIIARLMKKIGN